MKFIVEGKTEKANLIILDIAEKKENLLKRMKFGTKKLISKSPPIIEIKSVFLDKFMQKNGVSQNILSQNTEWLKKVKKGVYDNFFKKSKVPIQDFNIKVIFNE